MEPNESMFPLASRVRILVVLWRREVERTGRRQSWRWKCLRVENVWQPDPRRKRRQAGAKRAYTKLSFGMQSFGLALRRGNVLPAIKPAIRRLTSKTSGVRYTLYHYSASDCRRVTSISLGRSTTVSSVPSGMHTRCTYDV